MDTILCHASAYSALNALRASACRAAPLDPSARREPARLDRLPEAGVADGPPDNGAVERAAAACGAVQPVHILVGRRTGRHRTACRAPHTASGPLVAGSLVRLGPGVLSSSPEHLFLQMASTFCQVDLIWLGCELCAVYSLAAPRPEGADERGEGIRPAMPLTSIALLEDYLTRARSAGMKGSVPALQALRRVLEGAASPWEVALALAMTLPRAMGGYAVPKPQLNHRVVAEPRRCAGRGAPVARQRSFACDECWPSQRLVVEYDSDSCHAGPLATARDNDRRAALEDLGYRVIPVSTEQLKSLALSDAVFRRVAAHLGVRDRERELSYDWQARRWELRCRLRHLASTGLDWE